MVDRPDPMPTDDSLVGVLRALRDQGITGDLQARDGGRIDCGRCGGTIDAGELLDVRQRRLEGVSDPADMMLVVTGRCPGCDAHGALVLSYGPEASAADAAVLDALPAPASPAAPEPQPPDGSDVGATER